MQRVCFCDLETSGLSADRNQILEVAMVEFDRGEIYTDRALHFYIDNPQITYDLDALKKFGDRVKDRKQGVPVLTPSEAITAIRGHLIHELDAIKEKVTMGGKNFGSFDLPFLLKLDPDFYRFIGHRSVDIGNRYEARSDTKMPDLETCRRRAIVSGVSGKFIGQEVMHTALEDAALCAELYAGWYNGLLGNPLNPTWEQNLSHIPG